MRYSNHFIAAAVAGLATAALSTGALAQKADEAAIRAAAAAAGITDPDAIAQLINPKLSGVGLEQWGCRPTDKVYGSDNFAFEGFRYGGCLARGADKNPDAFGVLVKAAQATGTYRNNAYGFRNGPNGWIVLGDTTALARVMGSGTWMGETNAGVRIDYDLRIPAVRLQITHADGKQDIWVTTDPRKHPTGRNMHLEQPELFGDGPLDGYVQATWKEEPAGVYAGASDMSSEELLAIAYLQPQG